LITGYHLSCAVHLAAKLGLADLLAEGPRSSTELAGVAGTDVRSLTRVLRLLVSAGILNEEEQGRFALTSIGSLLRSDVSGSMRSIALLWGGRPQLAWTRLLHCVETGKPAFPRVFGKDPFSYMSEHREDAAIFDDGMAALTQRTATAVAAAYDFSKFEVVVDVGGGNGTLVAGILAAFPPLRGVVFDLPHVAERAAKRIDELALLDRCQVASGDFFVEVPTGADGYILANVITDWDDDRACTILRNCRRAIGERGKVLIVEPIYPDRIDSSPPSRAAVSTDVNVMVCTGGRMRTEQEFRSLYDAAGLRLAGVIRTSAAACVIEGVPA
jgi:hypothetical protein